MKSSQFSRYAKQVFADRTLIFLVFIAFLFPTTLTLLHSQETSPIDEWVFIDYTDKVFEQGYVHEGERVGDFTVELMACQGVLPGSTFGDCGAGEKNYSALPYTGLTAAAAYTPTYFFLTRVVGLPFQLFGADALTAWRLTGSIWLAAAIIAFVLLLRSWGISNRRIIPLGLLIIASPYVWWAHTFVSTDAPSLFVGALLLLLATKIQRGKISPWWLIPVATFSAALKVTNLVSVGLVSIYLLTSFAVNFFKQKTAKSSELVSTASGWQIPAAVITSGLFAVSLQIFWAKFISATALSVERVDQGISMQLTASELALQVVNFLPSVMSYSAFSGHGKDFIWAPLSWIPIAGVIGSFFFFKKRSKKTIIVISVLSASLFMAPLLALAVQIAQGAYFQLSPRYGASLIPAFLLCVGFLLRNRIAQYTLVLYSILLFAVGLYAGITLT